MIESFSNRLAEDLFDNRRSKTVLRFSPDVVRAARRKLLYLHDASELGDIREPPGNRLEVLKGKWAGFYSIRINEQWRLVFRWENDAGLRSGLLDKGRSDRSVERPAGEGADEVSAAPLAPRLQRVGV